MCGVFGWSWNKVGRVTADVLAQRGVIISHLARSMDTRGDQSWGLYAPASGMLHKEVGSIQEASMLQFVRQTAALGHTRFATHGTVCEKNAHPFEIGRLVGAHNGVLSNHEELNKKHTRLFRVDSMHLLAHIDADLPLDDIAGYGTLEFARRGESAIYVGRFNGGELSVWKTDLGAVWASTIAAVHAALKAAGVGGIVYKVEEGALYRIEDGLVYEHKPKFFASLARRSMVTWQWYSKYTGGDEWDSADWIDGPGWSMRGSRSKVRETIYERELRNDRMRKDREKKSDAGYVPERSVKDRLAFAEALRAQGWSGKRISRLWEADCDPLNPNDKLYNIDEFVPDTDDAFTIAWEIFSTQGIKKGAL